MTKIVNITRFLSMAALLLLSIGFTSTSALAQYLYAYENSGSNNAPPKNGLALLTYYGDVRSYSSDPEFAENGNTDSNATQLNYIEVRFSDTSGGNPDANPATAVRAKLWDFKYVDNAVTYIILAIPESGFSNNNPYVTIWNDNVGNVYQFQLASGSGGTLVERPHFFPVAGGGTWINGSIKAQAASLRFDIC